MNQKVVTIVGGTGFLGRYIVKHLAAAGYTLRIIVRNPEAALHLKTAGDVGQIVLMGGDLARPETLSGKLAGSYAVINLVGVLYERGRQRFSRLHAKGAGTLAMMARDAGAERFIHVSALAVDRSRKSKYARTKLQGEQEVRENFEGATILRPSVLFGPEDNFFNQFARMAKFFPALPLVGGGRTRLQPVYVDDVAKAVRACLSRADTLGETYELGGPHIYTLQDVMEYSATAAGLNKPRTVSILAFMSWLFVGFAPLFKQRALVRLPFLFSSMKAFGFELISLLPFTGPPLLTRDQVRSLKTDNVVAPHAFGFAKLGIAPVAVEMVVPDYLSRFTHKAVVQEAVRKAA